MTLRRLNPLCFFFAFALTVNAAIALILRVNPRPAVAIGACCDLLITVPLAYYLLVVRRGAQPVYTIAPVLLAGLLRASCLVPAPAFVRAVIAIGCEAGVVAFILTLGRDTRAARMLRGELDILRTAFLSWRDQPDIPPGARAFTVHQQSGIAPMLGLLAAVSLLEAAGVHWIVRRWSHPSAWILTALSVYGAILIAAIARSFSLRPILLTDDALHLRNGLIWTLRVPRDSIAAVRPASQPFPKKRAKGYLAITNGSDPKWMIDLHDPLTAQGLYGIRREVRTIGLSVDQATEFQRTFEQWRIQS